MKLTIDTTRNPATVWKNDRPIARVHLKGRIEVNREVSRQELQYIEQMLELVLHEIKKETGNFGL